MRAVNGADELNHLRFREKSLSSSQCGCLAFSSRGIDQRCACGIGAINKIVGGAKSKRDFHDLRLLNPVGIDDRSALRIALAAMHDKFHINAWWKRLHEANEIIAIRERFTIHARDNITDDEHFLARHARNEARDAHTSLAHRHAFHANAKRAAWRSENAFAQDRDECVACFFAEIVASEQRHEFVGCDFARNDRAACAGTLGELFAVERTHKTQ